MREGHPFAKESKCSFGGFKVKYLGHIISVERVATCPSKIDDVRLWTKPQTVKQLRGFLCLTGYYRHYNRGYNMSAQALAELLRKEGFHWLDTTIHSFDQLKVALTSAHVLRLPDFSKEFVVDVDALSMGISVVFMQDFHPIAFIIKSLSPRCQSLSVYEKVFLAIKFVVCQWHFC